MGNSGKAQQSQEKRYQCLQDCRVSKQWYGSLYWEFLTCGAQSLLHVTESALKVVSGRKIPCSTGDSKAISAISCPDLKEGSEVSRFGLAVRR